MRAFTQKLLTSAASATLICIASSSAFGGNGNFRNGEFDFCISVRFSASASDLQKIRNAFQNGSQVLADATDNQHRFGTVTIVNNSGATDSAEYWVRSGAGRAYATYGGYGTRGQQVNLYFDSNFQASQGADGDAYTVAHEHAHHAYGLGDGYAGPAGPAGNAPLPDTPTLDYSLMDNFFTRGGRAFGGGYTLNEFSVPSNHDPDGDTFQTAINMESDWETISKSKFPATSPTNLPVSAAPAPHTVLFEEGVPGLGVMLVLDRSGSMGVEQRIEFAKSGASQFVSLMQEGDSLGVASFADSASVNFNFQEVTGSSKTQASSAINSLSASGLTNIGGGLSSALGQLVGSSTKSCNDVIVLLSDGDHNTGTNPVSVIPQLKEEGITVFSIGVGSGISTSGQATLQNIANSTGGRFFRIASAAQLSSVFAQLSAETQSGGILARAPESIGSESSIENAVLVEQGSQRLVFLVAIADSSDQVELVVRSPSGTEFSSAGFAPRPGIRLFEGSNFIAFDIKNPEDGEWEATIESGIVNTGIVDFLSYSVNPGAKLILSLDDAELEFPERAIVRGSLYFDGLPVVGAQLSGVVRRPDGSTVNISLNDTGAGADRVANDGEYGAFFDRYSEDGTYTFDITGLSRNANFFPGESLFSGEPSNSRAAPEFLRLGSVTAVVSGVPEIVVATIELIPEKILLNRLPRDLVVYIELPQDFDVAEIDISSLRISEILGERLANPIRVKEARRSFVTRGSGSAIGDFDRDGIQDLRVVFDLGSYRNRVPAGMVPFLVEGQLSDGTAFSGERAIAVVDPRQRVEAALEEFLGGLRRERRTNSRGR